ncbi:cyclophilin-like fold protein [Streptococcus caviae]|uniref:cyclophilin-like fold protein n=1 Tax=Streptococcus sp. 'caviae' TaxID=1915004 RepID=UPI00094B8C99|nr:cyclophilin-like fold protein [Streptococcus sp. 'caviae']OLN83916.1 hypothetical protein BMI76_04355 [Streptococcus sp. 'caviae']
MTSISLTIDNQKYWLELADTTASQELLKKLEDGPIKIAAEPYGGFELVGELGESLTANDTSLSAKAGDVMLYQGDKLVFFYGNNKWSYTRIGHVSDQNFQTALKKGARTITLQAE